MSIPMVCVCVCVCESARDCIIERLNFVIKILWGVRILNKVLMVFISLMGGVWFAAYT